MAKKLELSTQICASSHLIINPYGPARLFMYETVILDTSAETTLPTGRDLNFLFRCNPNQTFDIQYRANSSFSIAIHVGENWVSTVTVRQNRMSFDDIYEAGGSTVTHHFNVDARVAPPSATMKLVLRNLAVTNRIDFRVANSTWFAAIIMHGQLIVVRPNGNWFLDQVIRFTRTVAFQSQHLDRPFQPMFQDRVMTGRLDVWPRSGYAFSQLTKHQGEQNDAPKSLVVAKNVDEPIASSSQNLTTIAPHTITSSLELNSQNVVDSASPENVRSNISPSQMAVTPVRTEPEKGEVVSEVPLKTTERVIRYPTMKSDVSEWNSEESSSEELRILSDDNASDGEDTIKMPRLVSTFRVPDDKTTSEPSTDEKAMLIAKMAEMLTKMFEGYEKKRKNHEESHDKNQ